MRIDLIRSPRRTTVTVTGLSGLVVVAALFMLPYFLVAEPTPERAVERVRQYLSREVSLRHQVELAAQGRGVPDRGTALRWAAELRAVDRLEFLSTEVARPIFECFRWWAPAHVVRAVVRDRDGEARTRYFWLGGYGIDRETSSWAWLISI